MRGILVSNTIKKPLLLEMLKCVIVSPEVLVECPTAGATQNDSGQSIQT